MNKKILIIEDEKPLLSALEEFLEKAGYEIEKAENGQEGLEKYATNKPDLILLDLLMPVMDGITFLQKIKNEDGILPIPVIVLTNLSDDTKVAEAIENGASDYLVKADWKLEEVAEKIKKTLISN